jgi:phosphate starvation-inducible PhoH-like protein
MIEKTIYLEGVEPVTIYGVNNTNLDKIKSLFPKIRIIARGNEIKAIGESSEIIEFEEKIESIIELIHRKNTISGNDIEHIVLSTEPSPAGSTEHEEDALIYGNHGKAIKAKTINQRKLVEEFKENTTYHINPAGC